MSILRYTYNFLSGYNLDIVDDGYNNNSGGDTTFTTVDTYNDLPSPTGLTDTFYVVLNSIGTEWLPGSIGGTFYSKGFYYSNGVTWSFLGDVPYQATQNEVNIGTNTNKFVTPNTLKNFSGLTIPQITIGMSGTTIYYANTSERMFVEHTVPFTVVGSATPVINATYEIIDKLGTCYTNNITFSGNGKTIRGLTNWKLDEDWYVLKVVYNGTDYNII